VSAPRPKHEALAVDGSDYEISLSKFIGKKVVDLTGYATSEFGSSIPVFKVCRVVFEDGTSEHVEGEHDIPYIPTGGPVTEEGLNELLAEDGE